MDIQKIKNRRIRVLDQIIGSIAILPAASFKMKNGHHEYRFRQDSNFYYLTGFKESESILVLDGLNKKDILYVTEKDPLMELWHGKRLGTKQALEFLDVAEVRNISQFDQDLPKLLEGCEYTYLDDNVFPKMAKKIQGASHKLRENKRSKGGPCGLLKIDKILAPMRQIKDELEIDKMKRANQITAVAHRLAMAKAGEGRHEYELQAIIEYTFRAGGAEGEAYTSIVASGDNANTLHYVENLKPLINGDLVLIDAGCEYDFYASDVTRTFPVNGKYTGVQSEVYSIVLEAQEEIIQAIRPGHSLQKGHELAIKKLSLGLRDLGVFDHSLDQIIDEGLWKKYYPHGTSHWLGLETHDVGEIKDRMTGEDVFFKAGMALTVEPGLYFPKDDESIPENLRGIGVRIEDDIVVTKEGHLNLSASIPKTIKDVQEACSLNYLEILKESL